MQKELIESVNPVTPTKGSNAGKQMFVINGKHWSRIEPKASDTHVCLEDVEVEGRGTFTNVVGYSNDIRMPLADKIKTLTSFDASYAQGIALLLK